MTKGVVLDAGAFIALERRDRVMTALAKRFAAEETPLVTSAAVVAQVWRGGARVQVPIAFLLRRASAAGPFSRRIPKTFIDWTRRSSSRPWGERASRAPRYTARRSPFSLEFTVIGLVIHVLCVGLPIAIGNRLALRSITKP